MRRAGRGGTRRDAHLIRMPLQIVHVVKTGVHEEGVQISGFLAEAGDAISALLGGAEFDLEGRLVAGVDNAEVVGHCIKGYGVLRTMLLRG